METVTEHLPTIQPINGRAIVGLAEDQPASLPMPVQVKQIVARVKAVKEIVSEVFEIGNHFGEIPGTAKNKDGSAKMVLLKPGFDALCLAFQFSPEFIKQPESIETDKFINLVYKCRIIHSQTGRVIATGDGSCNSREEKYRWTTTAKKCPACGAEAIIKGRAEYGGGWVCFDKKGGCKAKYKEGDPAIEAQPTGRVENDNPWNFHNTLTKMAQKRAGMAAIITACGLSSDFTQDMEDFTPEVNDKSRRNEADMPPVDIQANSDGWRARTEADDRAYDSYAPRESEEQPEWRDAPPLPDFQPVQPEAPAFPADILKAREDVIKELGFCTTKESFQNLKGYMQSQGPSYADKRVTDLVNHAYAKAFPAKPKGVVS